MTQKPKVVAIIQARMGSARLTGKVLMDIAGKPMLWHVVHRASQSKLVDKVVIVTSTNKSDNLIVTFARTNDIPCFRGSEDDVLDRYYQAAKWMSADVIVRITADCPLIDPDIVDKVVRSYMNGDYDYVSNTNPPMYPDGLDTEVFSLEALKRTWYEAGLQSEREHVTPYIRKHPELFRIGNVRYGRDLSSMRWTVDDSRDLEFVRAVHGYLGSNSFTVANVLSLLKKHPELMEINAGIGRNEGYQKSLREDGLIAPE
ncbi:glycosyltransferase family protein [Candidatus Bipolaricaulota bacterium]|nr:glycosyltransferase family protein [Candidatus Bipolaricaulota bacterium]